jgi:hypothetical protein
MPNLLSELKPTGIIIERRYPGAGYGAPHSNEKPRSKLRSMNPVFQSKTTEFSPSFRYQGHCIYFSEAEICQNIEGFLTTKAQKEGITCCFMHPLCPLWLVFLGNSGEFKEILTIKK